MIVAGVIGLSLAAACSVGPSAGSQQARSFATAAAALQAQLSPTPVVTAQAPLPVASPVPSILSSPLAQAFAALPPRAGQPVAVTTDAGERLTVTVNAVVDPAQSANKYNQPKGRFVTIDWTLRNDGPIGHSVSTFAFELQTSDGRVYKRGLSAGLPEPELISGTVGQGQVVRGYVSYDVPVGSTLQSAIYQPLGNRQFVIADLTP